ncbi:MAG: DNA repair protein RecO [Candidatus Omnitrophota bacterium]
MAIVKSECIVLRRRDLRETSLLVTFFTREFGKITGEMKGIRADQKKFASSVEIFSLNDIIFYQSRHSSVHLISHCDQRDNFTPLRHTISKATAAQLMMELVDVVMPQEDRNNAVYDWTLDVLRALVTAHNADKLLTIFKIKMLTLSGFKPHLDSCVCCDSRIPGQPRFSLSMGGLLCPRCLSKDPGARSIFRGTIATILHIEKNDLRNNLALGMNPQIKRELDLVLNSFLNFHLGKELKSQRSINKLADALGGSL